MSYFILYPLIGLVILSTYVFFGLIGVYVTSVMIFIIGISVAYFIYKSKRGRNHFAFYVVESLFLLIIATAAVILHPNSLNMIVGVVLSSLGFDIKSEIPIYGFLEKSIVGGMTIIVAFFIYRFASKAHTNWDGVKTQSDLALHRQGNDEPKLYEGATEHFKARAEGSSDSAVNTFLFEENLLLEPPEAPQWKDFTRDLVEGAITGILFSEERGGWIADLNAWNGVYRPPDMPGRTLDPVYVFPVVRNNLNDFERHIDNIRNRGSLDENTQIYFCVDTDDEIKLNYQIIDSRTRVYIRSRVDLLRENINFDTYAQRIIERFDRGVVVDSKISLSDIFVEPTVMRDSISKPLCEVIETFIGSNEREHLCILGDYGQGKSTALLAWCAKWARRYLDGDAGDEPVPLLITLRGRNPQQMQSPQGFLAEWGGADFGLDGKKLYNLVRAGRAIPIFEGFDEIVGAGLKDARRLQLGALWRFAFPQTKIIFSGRPGFFFGQEEERALLLATEESSVRHGARGVRWRLNFFQEEEVKSVLEKFPTHRDEIMQRFVNDDIFRDIAARPSMLPLIATVWPRIARNILEGEAITSGEVIREFVRFELDRKEVEVEDDRRETAGARSQTYLQIPIVAKEFFLEGIARAMVLQGTPNTIGAAARRITMRKLLRAALPAFEAPGNTSETLEFSLSLRTQIKDYGLEKVVEVLESEIRGSSLLVPDPASGKNNSMFAHKQFYEYFIASHILSQFEGYKKMWYINVIKSLPDNSVDLFSFSKAGIISSEMNSVLFFADLMEKTPRNKFPFSSFPVFDRFIISYIKTMLILSKLYRKIWSIFIEMETKNSNKKETIYNLLLNNNRLDFNIFGRSIIIAMGLGLVFTGFILSFSNEHILVKSLSIVPFMLSVFFIFGPGVAIRYDLHEIINNRVDKKP